MKFLVYWGLILDEISIPLGCLDVYNLVLSTSID
uniref:Uncharacterized protein n=1 Tax=Manihot esculenta TaxID=3983 RepID=A0A199UD28_MANES